MPVKLMLVSKLSKMNGELPIVQNLNQSIVNVHIVLILVMDLGIVKLFTTFLLNSSPSMILMEVQSSILKIKLTNIIMMKLLLIVIITMTENLIPVKSTNVLSIVKMTGDLKTVLNRELSNVIVHSLLWNEFYDRLI